MIKKYSFIVGMVGFLGLTTILEACKGPETKDPRINNVLPDVQIMSPSNKTQYVVGEIIEVDIKVNRKDDISDLKLIYDNQVYQQNLILEDQIIRVKTEDSRVGNLQFYISYIDKDGIVHQDVRTVSMFSDIEPKQKKVKVIAKHTHNPSSYTQGLEFYKGNLYESTGQYGSSLIAEVDLNTGFMKRKVDLDDTYFGEGMTIMNDTIYQITYKSQICKVYDLSFNLIKEFSYTGEGWGLTNNGHQLIMTNGSDEIVWRNKNTFAVEKSIQIFDDRSSLTQLNEIELIEGSLYANIYTDNRLVEIDTLSGKILSYVDCSSLVLEQPAGVDYFNGIAFNQLSNKIYVTGKLWPTLYEVTFE